MKAMMARFEALVIENFKLQQELANLSEKLAQETETSDKLRKDRSAAWENAEDLERLLTAAKDAAADGRTALRAAKEEVYRLSQELAKSKAIPAEKWDAFADSLVAEDVATMVVKPDVIYPDKTNVYWDNKIKRVKTFRDGTMSNLIEAKTAIESAARRCCGI